MMETPLLPVELVLIIYALTDLPTFKRLIFIDKRLAQKCEEDAMYVERYIRNNLVLIRIDGEYSPEMFTTFNGKRHGEFRRYYGINKSLACFCHYKHGRLHGESKSFWYTGQLMGTSTYANDVLIAHARPS